MNKERLFNFVLSLLLVLTILSLLHERKEKIAAQKELQEFKENYKEVIELDSAFNEAVDYFNGLF